MTTWESWTSTTCSRCNWSKTCARACRFNHLLCPTNRKLSKGLSRSIRSKEERSPPKLATLSCWSPRICGRAPILVSILKQIQNLWINDRVFRLQKWQEIQNKMWSIWKDSAKTSTQSRKWVIMLTVCTVTSFRREELWNKALWHLWALHHQGITMILILSRWK